MLISAIEQEVTDFDWYAVDLAGCLVHFASGGGPLPSSVASSHEVVEQLHAYFLALPLRAATAHINPHLAQVVQGVVDMNRYVESFTGSAQRGLFAFDRTTLASQANQYHLVASPGNILLVEQLPPTIATLVSRTRLPFAVNDILVLDVDSIQ